VGGERSTEMPRNRPIEKCPRTGAYCCLCNTGPDTPCKAEIAYDILLNCFYPNIQTLPIGLESTSIAKDIQKVICRHIVRRHNRIRKELQNL
jgi:hypothetical protein